MSCENKLQWAIKGTQHHLRDRQAGYFWQIFARLSCNIRRLGGACSLLLLLFFLWELGVRWSGIPGYILPAPTAIFAQLGNPEIRVLLWSHSTITLLETVYGLLVSTTFALIVCYFMGRYHSLYRSIYPLLVLSQSLPSIIIAPLLMISLGFGMLTKITVITLYCFFPIATSFSNGLRSVDPDFFILMKSLHASFDQIFFKIQARWALPSFFAGLRIAATYSVSGAVLSEFFGSQKGMGIFLRQAFSSSRTDLLFLIAFSIVFFSISFLSIVVVLEKYFCRHQMKFN